MYLISNLRHLLRMNGLNAHKLSLEGVCTQSTLQRVLSGATKNPSDEILNPIALYFKVDLNDLKYVDLASNGVTLNDNRPIINTHNLVRLGAIPVTSVAEVRSDGTWVIPEKRRIGTVKALGGESCEASRIVGDYYHLFAPHGWFLIVDESIEPRSGERVRITNRDNSMYLADFLYKTDDSLSIRRLHEDAKPEVVLLRDILGCHYVAGICPPRQFTPD